VKRSVHVAVAWPFLAALVGMLVVLAMLVALNVLSFAYSRIGVGPGWILSVLLLSVAGSFVNVPVATVRTELEPPPAQVVSFMGIRYVVPTPAVPNETRISVNVGGALVPTALSVYLVLHDHLLEPAVVGVVIVSVLVHFVARPVRGVGIAVPILLPAVAAALVASFLTTRDLAALAYIIGVMGVLIGADLTNLSRTRALGASMVSIGGAGTFDGIFLTGILAVLLAAL
jgi:uncharacterized membrane protein